MRFILAASLFSLAVGAPSRSRLVDWANALGKSLSWFEGAATTADPSILHALSNADDQTIYEFLKDADEFSILAKLIDKDQKLVDFLNDETRGITLFAPNDEAFQAIRDHSPWGGDHLGDHKHLSKEMIRAFVSYHVLPEVVEYSRFGQNSTLATELRAEDGTFGGHKRRVKVERSLLFPPAVKINTFATITESDIHAKNGIIQKLDRPLFPPPDAMDALYLFPREFSITGMALLKVNIAQEFEFNRRWSKDGKRKGNHGSWDHHPHDGHHPGSSAVTLFVPTNAAWEKLPQDLTMFLFSLAGENTLRKILQFHTLPDEILFTEWMKLVNSDDEDHLKTRRHHCGDGEPTTDEIDEDLGFDFSKNFPTLVEQHLPIEIVKSKSKVPLSNAYNIEFRAHGIDVESRDNVVQNGAVHTIGSVICPRHEQWTDENQNQSDWNEWRDWLVKWSYKTEESKRHH